MVLTKYQNIGITSFSVVLEITVRLLRLVVRTPGFHPGNRSSILLGDAKAAQ